MDVTTAATLSGLSGVVLGAGAILAARVTERQQHAAPEPAEPTLPAGVGDVLSVLRSSGIVLDRSDAVVNNSPAAVVHGLVRGNELVHNELKHLARQVRRDGVIREAELDLARAPSGQARAYVRARVAPLGSAHVLLLIEDMTAARRVDEVRRDFIANVSHELKTPVGGISLLSEAVLDAKDDPEAIARFAGRMRVEASRLSRLVTEIIDLSRLQTVDPMAESARVDIGRVVGEALDRTKLAAEDNQVELAAVTDPGAMVYGDEDLLVTAVHNLLSNAVTYSEPGTRVTVRVVRDQDTVQVAVTDQGSGIPEDDLGRVFERFYRVDSARSRATGGTGLGLAIVKHICENHGGHVSVWSHPGQGSTFTMSLPAAQPEPDDALDPLPAHPEGTP